MVEAIILGIVQGLTEFLPVSSTAHLILLPWFFGWKGDLDSLTFDVALHAGTLLSLIICFWKDWVEILLNNRKLLALLVVATLPAGIAGILFNDAVETTLRSPLIIVFTLVLFGIVMLISERWKRGREIKDMTFSDAIIIGTAQAIALIPGVSRSGITISAGLFRGLGREASARFSFILSTPVIFGATLLEGRKLISKAGSYDLNLFMAGVVTSAVTGYIAIKFLLYFLKKHPLNIFVYYRFVLALIIIGGIWLKG
ncbi:MAG: undecaprenyl-diphosphatase UppP [Thermodesulfovibrionales bacterium]|nr:undecaprenyl-diphosphatase UppP [Nitrospinota bacterium]MCG2813137.1 undecaprenyl-diphosphatase UppP [Thermodesulfovibrionales bacterium]MDP3048225.1 undecaprenyl-diphosphatase UppP [Thermodesulfovibrionales bacterium]